MPTIETWLDDYGESHRNPVNKTIHWICVPVIYWTVMALLWAIPTPSFMQLTAFPINWAIVALAVAQAYYFALSLRLGLGLLVINLLLLGLTWWIDTHVPIQLWLLAVVLFVAAWIGQFIGHHIEGKKPSFFKDVQFLLIGPAWLLAHLYRKVGLNY